MSARGVTPGKYRRNSAKREQPSFSASATNNDHFFSPTSSDSIARSARQTRAHAGAASAPALVNRYSGRIGWPYPVFRATSPSSTSASRARRTESRPPPRRFTSVTNLVAPF